MTARPFCGPAIHSRLSSAAPEAGYLTISKLLGIVLVSLSAMRIKPTNMLSIIADSLGRQTTCFEPVGGHGCSPKANKFIA